MLDCSHRNGSVSPSRTALHLTLFIPDLLPPDERYLAGGGPAAPALQRLLGRGDVQRFPAIDAEPWLCQTFEVEQRGDWPVAALTAAVDGLDTGNDWWLRADPVHLQMQRSSTRVLAAPALTLSNIEADALAASLNTHFSADGIAITAAHPTRWYIRQQESAAVAGPTLSAAAGRPLPRMAGGGAHASHWHRVLTEAQMVLHEHPVNAAREARGLPVVNSLLLWGGGRKPAVPGRRFSAVWTDDALAVALAEQSDADCAAVPANAASWLARKPDADGRHLITLDRAHHAARYGEPNDWAKAVSMLDEFWIAPLWAALNGRTLAELVIVITGPAQCLRCTLRSADKLKFWKRALPWPAIAGNY